MPNIRLFFCLFLALFLWQGSALLAQRKYDLHWISFKDKQGTPYSVFHPQAYLSPLALERRQRYGCAIDSTDLPINPQYLSGIRDKGFKILHQSRWLNGAAVLCNMAEALTLAELPYVAEVRAIGFAREPEEQKGIRIRKKASLDDFRPRDNPYGLGRIQIEMLNGHYLHKMGHRGRGAKIAIMDGGFIEAPHTPALDSLFLQGRIVDTRDFVEGDKEVYESSDHGRDVLACMGSNHPYLLIGTSPDAHYYLYKTEDERGEYVAEEYHWVSALEYADSMGVDVVNTSLGYYDFDDNKMDYGYDDIDGKTAPSTLAARIGASKGMILVTSAGNEGDGKWKHITVPADAPEVLTVGAVEREGQAARFSSEGFADRTYIKPNLMARGHGAIVAAPNRYDTRYQHGTSFSSPILAGMVASLQQALPEVHPQALIRELEASANRFHKPDTKMGNGIPNFLQVYQHYTQACMLFKEKDNTTASYWLGIPKAGYAPQVFMDLVGYEVETILFNSLGQIVEQKQFELNDEQRQNWHYSPEVWAELPTGSYLLYIKLGSITRHIYIPKT